jgi:hypothetical protein
MSYSNKHCLFKNNSNTLFSVCVFSASGRFPLVFRPEFCQKVLFLLLELQAILPVYPLFDRPNRILWRLQTKELLLKQISPYAVSSTPLDPNTYCRCYCEIFCKLTEMFNNICPAAANVVNRNGVKLYKGVLNVYVCWRNSTLRHTKTNLRPKYFWEICRSFLKIHIL